MVRKILQKASILNAAQSLATENGWFDKKLIAKTEVEFLVDTGAAMICLPIRVIDALGLKRSGERKAQTANGEVTQGIYSPIILHILDRDAIMEVMEVPNDTPPLLGYLALETLYLYPNPKLQILEGNPARDGKMVVDLL
jgi:predicted aspartyl protease